MSRWFRHYAGMVRDDKLVRIATRAKQPIERVVWVFGAILESAAEINDGGKYDLDPGEAAHFLRCEEADVSLILETMTSLARLGDGRVTRWASRQFTSDTSALRMRRHRARKKRQNTSGNNGDSGTSRDVTVTYRETDKRQSTESKKVRKKESKEDAPSAPGTLERSKEDSPEGQFWELATKLTGAGISRARSAQLLKLNGGDFAATLVQLARIAEARDPTTYIGKVIANLKAEQASLAVPSDAGEPDFVREFRAEGYRIERRSPDTWRIAGEIYDNNGRQIGW